MSSMNRTRRPEPVSRRTRPAKAALTRQSIVAAAVRLLDEEKVGRLTMRRVASELDTGPASLYVYFRNAEELHAGVLEEFLQAVELPARGADRAWEKPWRERLVELLTSYTRVLFDHPEVARTAAFTRPSGPNSLRLLEAVLALLVEGGVSPRDAAWGVDVLLLHATTHALEQSTRQVSEHTEEEDAALVSAVHELVAKSSPEHPHIVAIGDDLFSGEGEQRLAWSFEVLINCLLSTPRPDTAAATRS